MVDLRIKAAHGWLHNTRHGVAYRVDYYAIGNPDLFGLFSAIVAEKGKLPNIGIVVAPGFAPGNGPGAVSGFATFWASKFGNPNSEKGGGELLDEDSVLILAACHPDWFEAKAGLVRIRWTPYWAVVEGRGCVRRDGDWTRVEAAGGVRVAIRFDPLRALSDGARCR